MAASETLLPQAITLRSIPYLRELIICDQILSRVASAFIAASPEMVRCRVRVEPASLESLINILGSKASETFPTVH